MPVSTLKAQNAQLQVTTQVHPVVLCRLDETVKPVLHAVMVHIRNLFASHQGLLKVVLVKVVLVKAVLVKIELAKVVLTKVMLRSRFCAPLSFTSGSYMAF